jgi:antitoxin component YwqK of YwqJK toxin-antitoxin module
MKKIFFLFIISSISIHADAQAEYIDPITIKPDGTCKRFTYTDRTYHSQNVTTGLCLTFWDSGFTKIRTQVTISDGYMNGTFKFFNEQGFLLEMCNFKEGLKDGYYYYWNDKGSLLKKELWKENKKIKTIKLSSSKN